MHNSIDEAIALAQEKIIDYHFVKFKEGTLAAQREIAQQGRKLNGSAERFEVYQQAFDSIAALHGGQGAGERAKIVYHDLQAVLRQVSGEVMIRDLVISYHCGLAGFMSGQDDGKMLEDVYVSGRGIARDGRDNSIERVRRERFLGGLYAGLSGGVMMKTRRRAGLSTPDFTHEALMLLHDTSKAEAAMYHSRDYRVALDTIPAEVISGKFDGFFRSRAKRNS